MTKLLAFIMIGIFCVLALPAHVRAQAEAAIQGTVVAQADGSILPNSAIRLEGITVPASLTATAGPDGRFALQRLVPGNYMLIVARQDFAEERMRLELRPREVRSVTVGLSITPVQQTVVVEGTLSDVSPAYSPSATVIQAQTFDGLPLAQRNNLPDVIVTSTPGMIRGHDDFVHIRGHEVALNPFINGVSFWENPHAAFSSGLGADYIQSVNVMTGGFSAEYGNRFGGVLDVVTKSGFTMNNHGSLTLGVGTALRNNIGVEFGGHTGRAAFYLNVGGFESGRFLSPPDPRAIHDTGRGARSFLQLDFNVDPSNFLKLIVMGDGANFELPKTERDELLRPNFNNFERTRSQSLIFSWDHVHSAETLFHTSFYQKWSRVVLLPNPDPYGAKLDAERTLGTLGVKSDVTRFYGRHTLKGGVDLVQLRPEENLSYTSQPWIDFTHLPEVNEDHIHFRGPDRGPVSFSGRETGGQVSLYLQDKIQLTRNLNADIGLRFDRYSLAASDSHFSPRLNLAYRFDAGTVLYGSYNHFFVPPPVENVLAASAGLTELISEIGEPLPALRSIVENQFELGVTQPIARLLRVGLTGYYRISNDPVHTVLFPDSRFFAYANFDKGKAYGMEIKAEIPTIPAVGLSGYFNYALGRVYFNNPINAGFITEAEHIEETNRFLAPMDQTHTLTSGFTYRNRRTGLWGSMAFEYGSGTPGSHEEEAGGHGAEEEAGGHSHGGGVGLCEARCPSHFTQNLTLGWDALFDGDIPLLTFQFNIENLSDNVYLISKESTFVQGQYSIPRLVSGSVKFRF